MSEVIHYEAMVIGACLSAPELINQVPLQAADFRGQHHAETWATMQAIIRDNETPDLVSVSDRSSVPISHLADAMRECYSTDPKLVVSWGQAIRGRVRRERLASALGQIAIADDDADTMLHRARELLIGMEQDAPTKQRSNEEILNARINALESRLMGETSHVGLSWGVNDFDALSYGMRPSELIVLAARPGMGKSALALQAARQNAAEGKRVAFFSLEMDVDELFDRMICQAARFPADHYADPTKANRDLSVLGPAVVELRDSDLQCFDQLFTIEEITAKCRTLHQSKPLNLIVVDYLQLIDTKGSGNANRAVEVGQYSRALKMLAMQLGCPVLLLSQLNRNVETRPDKRPLMADLRESGSVEQDANKVIMIYRDEIYNEGTPDFGIAELLLRKHRGGPTGAKRCAGNLRCFRFDDLAHDHQQAQSKPSDNDPFA